MTATYIRYKEYSSNTTLTCVVEDMGDGRWRVSVYRDGVLDHRAWFNSEASADYYAARMRLGV